MNNQTFILCSGNSINNLTQEEKEYIKNSDYIISFNKYLIFWEIIGIIPNYHLQFDEDNILLQYTLDVTKRDKKLKNIRLQFPKNVVKNFKDENFYYIERRSGYILNDYWAENVNQEMYAYVDTQSSVINFAHILNPKNTIKLIGCDMNNSGLFFVNKNIHIPENLDISAHKEHPTRKKCSDLEQKKFTWHVKNKIESTGGKIYVCNKNSYYAENGFLEYSPVIRNE